MKKLFKPLALAMCLIMLFAFSGCGKAKTTSEVNSDSGLLDFDNETVSGKNNDSGTASGNDTNVSSGGGTKVEEPVKINENDPFSNIPKKLKGTTVKFAHFGDEGASEYQKVAKAFTKKSGIKVEFVSFAQAEYEAQVAKQINAGLAPDVVICNAMFPSCLAIMQPLNGIMDVNSSFWDKNTTKATTVGGKTYAVNSLKGPWINAEALIYNKQIFSNNGIKTPADYVKEGTWSWENYKKCLEDVVKAGKYGGKLDGTQMATSMGQPIISYDASSNTFKSNLDAAATYLQYEAQCVKEGLYPTSEWWGTFANGNTGMYPAGTYGLKYNGYLKNAEDNILAAVVMPTSYKGTKCKPSGGLRAYGIAKGAKNPEGAVYFLRYFLDYSYYSDAKANVFKNKSLEKFYFDTLMPQIEKEGIIFDYSENVYLQNGKTLGELLGALNEPAQVSTQVASIKNVVENTVKKCNETVAKYK